MKLAVIPARGGSKRISRKNIRSFDGKPIIGWSIEAALESGCFGKVIVSTDDPEIAAVALDFGAEVPFVRPDFLSDDVTPTGAVIQHAVTWCAEAGMDVDYCCCIYATAPFLSAALISEGMDLIIESGADYVVSVARFPSPIQRACRIRDGRLEMIDPDRYLTRSQDLEEAFHDAGQLYWGRFEAWAEQRPVFGASTVPLVLPNDRVQDIDTPEDWERAEWMSRYFNQSSKEQA